MSLSERLTVVSTFIPKGSILADIGSDHAYLPVYSVQEGIAKKVIVGEVADGPLQSSKKSVGEANLNDVIEVRKGDGLEVIQPEDGVSCITICGMGGTLIRTILEQGKEKLQGVKRLVLQPNVAAITIREWLIAHEWELVAERILKEDGHIYEVLVAERGDALKPYQDQEKELLFGPFLLKEMSPIFKEKWTREKTSWENILNQLKKTEETAEIKRKKADLQKKIGWYEEVFKE